MLKSSQNTFANVKVGASTISADTKSDTLELVAGTGITLTPDTTNDKITIDGVNQYVHPTTHPASMITGLPTSLPANGGNADTVGGFTVGVSVPANAKFTDTNTITTINSKTGAISKADIVALGIPAQDTVYTHPSSHAISFITDLQGALDGKVDNSQVLTNVPANAKFTDTNTTYAEITTSEIDIGTGTTLRTITARRIKYILDKAQDMVDTLSGTITTALAGKVDNSKVLTDVPANAKFTDTVYTHPSTAGNKHIPTGGASGQVLKYSASGTAVWGTDSNTITTINGKTGAIAKADITALGIPAQDTVYAHPTNHPPSIITQDTNNRFVSDSEKSVWNGKQDALGFTPVNTTDSRLSDARTPTSHTHAESEITNLVTDLAGKEPAISTKLTAFNKNYNTLTANVKMDGTVAVGTQDLIARADHIHPKDTSKANLSSPTFTGAPKAPTATSGTNTTQIATTAFVQTAMSSAGLGDMLKGVYDQNNNGIVDNAEKVNGFTVGKSVPSNALFTDTVYTHPSSHPASIITQDTNNRFVTDAEKNNLEW